MSSPVDLGHELLEEIDLFANNKNPESLRYIKSLINSGADLEVRNGHDETPLMSVVTWGNVIPGRILSMLLFAGANANCRYFDGCGASPLMCSMYGDIEDVENAKKLIDAGANLLLKSPDINVFWFFSKSFTIFRNKKLKILLS